MYRKLLIFIGVALFFGACTNSRWIIHDEPQVDYTDRQTISSNPVVLVDRSPNLSSPIAEFLSAEVNEVNYAQKMVSERYVQQYRPRYIFMLLGFSTAAAAIYLANSNETISYNFDTEQRRSLTIAGSAAAVASIMSMRPHGDPRPTGEKIMLTRVGDYRGRDTTLVSGNSSVTTRIVYNNAVIAENEELEFSGGRFRLPFEEIFPELKIVADQPGNLTVELLYNEIPFNFQFPVEDILVPYLVIQRSSASLHSAPDANGSRVLANFEMDSFLPLHSIHENGWYETRYNLVDAYIQANDARVEWRIRTNGDISTVHSDMMAYGEIDVERTIPEFASQPHRVGVIINIGNYSGNMAQIQHNERSARLMRDYMNKSLGIAQENILQLTDINYDEWQSFSDRVDSTQIGSLSIVADSTELFVYYIGHGLAESANNLALLPADYALNGSRIFLGDFFHTFGRLQSASKIFMFETDFTERQVSNRYDLRGIGRSAALREITQSFLEDREDVAVFYASNLNQKAGVFTSADGRVNNVHGFFTYYLLQAIQNNQTNSADIFRFIQRNVTFTSRRYFDRPQDPQFFGNPAISIIPVEN